MWFAPLPSNIPERPGREYTGSADYMNLFNSTAPWVQASGHVEVFKFYSEWVDLYATNAQLSQAVSDLNRRGIAIALEVPPLPQTSTCGQGVEGFASSPLDWTSQGVQRIEQAGGLVTFLAMDEPFYFGKFFTGPGACNWSTQMIAQQVFSYIQSVRAMYPSIVVGDIEPLAGGVPVSEYEGWVDAYHTVSSFNFPWLHIDTDWSRPDWPTAAQAIETYMQARGIQFGMLYFGDYNDVTDAQWTGKAEQRFATFEAEYGGRPDQVVFQSWQAHPKYTLPESTNSTFTHLILRYFRMHTSLSMATAQGSVGSLIVSGKLIDASGNPIGGVHVGFYVTALNGSGIYAAYTLSGLVPNSANSAVVGVRVNTECKCSGTSNISVYQMAFAQGNGNTNLVPNPAFSQGFQYWGHWGNGTVAVKPSDRGSGNMLSVLSNSNQYVGINSGSFPVTAGSNYNFTVGARASPTSFGSGYFTVIFLKDSTELARYTVFFSAPSIKAGDAVTGQDGTFSVSLQLPGYPKGTGLQVEAIYAGDDLHWPAYAKALVKT